MSLEGTIGAVEDILEEFKGEDVDYAAVFAKARNGLAEVLAVIDSMSEGDYEAAKVQMTKWADVNRTLQAIQDVNAVRANDGVDLTKVLDFAGSLVKIGVTLATMV